MHSLVSFEEKSPIWKKISSLCPRLSLSLSPFSMPGKAGFFFFESWFYIIKKLGLHRPESLAPLKGTFSLVFKNRT